PRRRYPVERPTLLSSLRGPGPGLRQQPERGRGDQDRRASIDVYGGLHGTVGHLHRTVEDPMNVSRRQALLTTLFGAGWVGLRSVATGLPIGFLLNPRKAPADMTCTDAGAPLPTSAQYVIFSTSGNGDPINANCPGSYTSLGNV